MTSDEARIYDEALRFLYYLDKRGVINYPREDITKLAKDYVHLIRRRNRAHTRWLVNKCREANRDLPPPTE